MENGIVPAVINDIPDTEFKGAKGGGREGGRRRGIGRRRSGRIKGRGNTETRTGKLILN